MQNNIIFLIFYSLKKWQIKFYLLSNRNNFIIETSKLIIMQQKKTNILNFHPHHHRVSAIWGEV